ncbi:50S ribosomal protein L25/general stress protein Ctc [Candidatus Pelagibacter sp.]|nr:50S ribosomal protein L25/general stress protein Ctc [Candidatus Pelagibacter sp.]
MTNLEANQRTETSRGKNNILRKKGMVPGVLYGGDEKNELISVSKKHLKNLLDQENFLSNVLKIKIKDKEINVLPREVAFDVVSDEPIHVDFLRMVAGRKIILEIPVKFINMELSPGLKRGGVLNIVRRKVELKCPTESIPKELVVDLEGLDIGASIKISAIKLPENVSPTITGRDFVIATVAAPTIVKEPEKPVEETAEGAEAGAEGEAPKEGEQAAAAGDESKKPEADKDKKEAAPEKK